MGSDSIVYFGIYALIYQHTILGEGIVSRDGLPRGVLPSGILKIEKYCPGLKVPVSCSRMLNSFITQYSTMKKSTVSTSCQTCDDYSEFLLNKINYSTFIFI